jgi:hypothetical protein
MLTDAAEISSFDNEKSCKLSSPPADSKAGNAGDPVTRTEQLRILSSTCLVAFTVIGSCSSFDTGPPTIESSTCTAHRRCWHSDCAITN